VAVFGMSAQKAGMKRGWRGSCVMQGWADAVETFDRNRLLIFEMVERSMRLRFLGSSSVFESTESREHSRS
jgi:hypothetical protein